MPTNVDIEDTANNAEWLASLALTIETALTEGKSTAEAFIGAAHILTGLLFDHAKALQKLCEGV